MYPSSKGQFHAYVANPYFRLLGISFQDYLALRRWMK